MCVCAKCSSTQMYNICVLCVLFVFLLCLKLICKMNTKYRTKDGHTKFHMNVVSLNWINSVVEYILCKYKYHFGRFVFCCGKPPDINSVYLAKRRTVAATDKATFIFVPRIVGNCFITFSYEIFFGIKNNEKSDHNNDNCVDILHYEVDKVVQHKKK